MNSKIKFFLLVAISASVFYWYKTQKTGKISIPAEVETKTIHFTQSNPHLRQAESPIVENRRQSAAKLPIVSDDNSKIQDIPTTTNQTTNEQLWRKYSGRLPKLYSYDNSSTNISNGIINDLDRIVQAQKESAAIENELQTENYQADPEKWKLKFNLLRNKYIELIALGDASSAWWLAAHYINPPMRDHIEYLSWVMIAVAMGFETNPDQVCDLIQGQCSETLFENAVNQASFYIDFYNLPKQ